MQAETLVLVTCFIISLFTAQHVSNVSTSIFRSLRLIVDLFHVMYLLWFDVCWCYVVVRLGWCGIVMQAEALGACDLFVELRHQIGRAHV